MLRDAVINIAVLALTVPACANAQNDDAQVLADNMPAMELQTDTTISPAYNPYLARSEARQTMVNETLLDATQQHLDRLPDAILPHQQRSQPVGWHYVY